MKATVDRCGGFCAPTRIPAAAAGGPALVLNPFERKARGPKMKDATIIVKPGEGHSVWLGGMGVVFKVSGADTGGAFAVVEHPIEPGRLILPHVHQYEDEYSYVLEGTIGARVGDREVVAGPGSYLIKPRGLMHSF